MPPGGRPTTGRLMAMKLPAAEKRDITVDFMDMTDDRRPWARSADVRQGFEPAKGRGVPPSFGPMR